MGAGLSIHVSDESYDARLQPRPMIRPTSPTPPSPRASDGKAAAGTLVPAASVLRVSPVSVPPRSVDFFAQDEKRKDRGHPKGKCKQQILHRLKD